MLHFNNGLFQGEKMAYTLIIFENPNTGAIKEVPMGFFR